MELVVVTDLDGTLIDTKLAVVKAYEAVGVEMPDYAWGRPWHEWLTDHRQHDAKNRVYPEMLVRYAEKLPLYDLAVERQIPVITGASTLAVKAVKRVFGRLNIVADTLSRHEKARFLNAYFFTLSVEDKMKRHIYVDDDETTQAYVKEFTSWETLSPGDFMRLYSQLAQTHA